MIVVDTSIWIDHFHEAELDLEAALMVNEVATHPLVIEEIALGSLADRMGVLALLAGLPSCPVLTHEEWLSFVNRRALWGRGLASTDVHLLGSVLLMPEAALWTRDRRLRSAARDLGIPLL